MRLTVGPRATGAVVAGEPDRLCQVLINIISNAIRYNDAPRPTVQVHSSSVDGNYVIEVTDNGPGIAQAERTLIFEKFARGKRGGDTGRTGTGLGLAISRQIVAKMNGTLELGPERDRGASFRVTLPLL
jgi:signal transduction histidine kinase